MKSLEELIYELVKKIINDNPKAILAWLDYDEESYNYFIKEATKDIPGALYALYELSDNEFFHDCIPPIGFEIRKETVQILGDIIENVNVFVIEDENKCKQYFILENHPIYETTRVIRVEKYIRWIQQVCYKPLLGQVSKYDE